jgi:hypothetical protein
MKKVFIFLSGLFANLCLTNLALAGTSDEVSMPSSSAEDVVSDSHSEVCKRFMIYSYSDMSKMSAQEIFDYEILLDMLNQITTDPLEYCDNRLMENMVFIKPTEEEK